MMKRENASFLKTQQRLETQLYAQDQELGGARKEIMDLARRNRDLESRLEIEVRKISYP
jgi:cell division protein FtsL